MIRWLLTNKLIVALLILVIIGAGISVAPFNWDTGTPRSPIAVDAIPNIGENQQIVFTEWAGRSPQDVDDQVSYPLSVALMGVPGVKDVRTLSMFGFSSIAVIFDDSVEFYWSRTRLLEKLSSLPAGTLPDGVQPTLGPDATALGQIDVDPEALRYYNVTIEQVMDAVRESNQDVGARTTEINRVEYMVRGVGFIRSLQDIEQTVVRLASNNIPIRVADVASVNFGFADEAQQAWTQWLKDHPREQWPNWMTLSQLEVVPFYDRSILIQETLGTLSDALSQQLIITAVVVLIMLLHFRAALSVATMLPLAVLLTFIGMRLLGVEANIVALAGIAIAIGTIVDMGIIVTDNVLRHRRQSPDQDLTGVIARATKEVAPAVATAIATTVISFLPVFTMTGAEGKLFTPLAYTKTLVLLAAIVLALVFVLLIFAVVVGGFSLLLHFYERTLRWCLRFKALFLALPLLVVALGAAIVPGLGREFMPPLDEGAFLLMPTTMPHASIGEALDVLSQQDRAIAAIPEVESVVGKIGRAETALDPAPVSMIETVIHYKSEFKTDDNGRRLTFAVDSDGEFARDEHGNLIESRRGRPYRQWREHIRSTDDIWQAIVEAARVPGVTSAPKLQPIETRQLMLQTGMRAAMGVKVQAGDLATLEQAALAIEAALREAPGVNGASVNAERVVGSPYLEIHLKREEMARYGLRVDQVQQVISAAIGGLQVTTSVEGRERYPIRVRYQREQRDSIEAMQDVLVTSATTILALFPVLTATGRGADLMIPMAIPTVGGLTFVVLSMFVVPVLYCWREERAWHRSQPQGQGD
ncbi:efflux RND transporter permease subunit [Aliidiomarina maris]|uniref:Cu(I)/Ag(I) efflux system membrane protein CusA/SilA n=1 Tax=Aliidiomarina maris TaxID=531312 RepID=A0A327X5G5_9GAMM|nr:efflux RND transporter permease subunit [Aliidiomarina maris]RAK00594.1 Cu(I)/Ag(I) efflux system membrane protein CusA/SilA [Aliidiomarina maris]RUO27394.1 hypothetical protein CWE07_05480 [Aliidiomarina maris]